VTEKETQFNHSNCCNRVHEKLLINYSFYSRISTSKEDGWMDGWLGFNSILSTQVVAISCLKKFKVC